VTERKDENREGGKENEDTERGINTETTTERKE
jgi:hypothetical protein